MSNQEKKSGSFFQGKLKYLIGLFVLLAIAGLGLGYLGVLTPKSKSTYFTVYKADLQKYIKDSTVLAPNDIRKVSAPTGSKITENLVKTGSEVTAGQVVAKAEQGGKTIDLISPINGVVVKQNYQTGESSDQQEVFQVADMSGFRLTSVVSSSEINAVKIDQQVKVKIKVVDSETEYDAKVTSIEPFASYQSNNELSSNYNVRIKLNDKPKGAVTGMKANVTIYGDKKESAVLVENNLIFQKSDGSKYVRVVTWINKDQNIFSLKDTKITTGLEGDKFTEVLTGVSDGEQITTPNDKTVTKPGFSLLPSSN
jgi:multidrug efflux pump subunit AcrA (membrane-fusion protein)